MPWLEIVLGVVLWGIVIAVVVYSKKRNKVLEDEHKQNVKDIAKMQREMSEWFNP